MGTWLVKKGESVHYMLASGELTEKVPEDLRGELHDVRSFVRNIKSEKPEPGDPPLLQYVRRTLQRGGDVLISFVGDRVFFHMQVGCGYPKE